MLKIDKFLKDNLVMFISGSTVSFFNFLYQLVMVRNLPSKVYGELNSLISLLAIIFLPCSSLNTMVVKFTSEFYTKALYADLKNFLHKLLGYTFIFSIIAFFLIGLFSPVFSSFLQLNSNLPIIFPAVIIFLSVVAIPANGMLQGMERFGWYATSSLISGFFKILLAFIFVAWMRTSIIGALWAFTISSLLAFIIPFLLLWGYIFNRIEKEKQTPLNIKEAYYYLLPTLVVSLCFSLLTNIDMILVKHFFSPSSAGTYSVAQIIGKIIFFLPSTITFVMFPKTASLYIQNKDTLHTLKRSLWYTAMLCISGVIIYNLFPQQVLDIITKKTGLDYVILGRLFSISMTFFALSGIPMFYQLSISNFRFIKYLIISTIIQILAVSFFSIIYENLILVLAILCINAIILFLWNLKLIFKK